VHKAVVAHFEIAAKDAESLKRFYASLFGRRIRTQDGGARNAYVIDPNGDGIEDAISYADLGGVRIVVAVDDVRENLCYAEELGGRIIDLPHEIMSAGRPVTIASFADPEGNRVGLSNGFQQFESARQMTA
jgi:predicted enzyme related to lactoylglutathione lyase